MYAKEIRRGAGKTGRAIGPQHKSPPPPEGARERRWGGSVLHCTAGHLQKIVGPSLSTRHPTKEPYVSQDRICFSTLEALSHGVKPPEGGVTSKVTLGEVNQPLASWTPCSLAAKTGIPRDATMTRKAFNLNNRICVPWEMVHVD